ncbi:hypothetical protein [Microbacterium sp. 2MCAF23]|uniref:hypothetical protein n=1 Tax=Microbacterium sp. 2MCAF23 TaxID=3232985 RepID=UPI003F9881B3
MLHMAATVLMIGSAIAAAACCLGAGRVVPSAVPWQARQSAVVMALGMVALCAGGHDARILLLVAVSGIVSAMLGVAGTRGRTHADACFHRALGGVVMAVCALAMLRTEVVTGANPGSTGGVAAAAAAGPGHAGHGGIVPLSVVAATGVTVLLGLMLFARVRHRTVLGRAAAVGARATASVVAVAAGGASSGRGVTRGSGVLNGRILLEAEGAAMAVSMVVMGAMVLVI